MNRLSWWSLVAALVLAVPTLADERLKGIACRSVHLGYPGVEGTAFYNEISVDRSSEGTYFMTNGWSKGYFGIQEQSKGKKVVIFSVWDPTSGDDPKKVKEENRVKMLHKDEAVRTGRFGNEGTGGQSFLDYDWKVGETYKFLVTAKPDGERRTAYSGYFFIPEKKEWKHLVTFSTITEGVLLKGCYSFVEDFRRNKISATKERVAHFGNGWIKDKEGKWVPLLQARFTGDANPVLNIDSYVDQDRFVLATGGETENKHTKLREVMTRPPTGVSLPEIK